MTIADNLGRGRDPAIASVAALWWVVALRAGLAIALGLTALFWPIAALLTFVVIFAGYCLVDALLSIVLAVRGARQHARWGWPALHALVALGAAAVALLYPGITLFAFVAMLIGWALLSSVAAIDAALQFDRAHGRWWLIASGLASLALAALLLAWPPVGLFTLVWMFAFYMLTAGFSMAGAAFRLREMRPQGSRAGGALPLAP